ncbi:MAG: ATP-dependent helicase [Mycoplasmatales bacterium]
MPKLNEKQIEAIKDTSQVICVLAGAGSGKTTVLTQRISYLYNEIKVDPKNILAITFTNKAAREMKERLLKNEGPYVNMSSILTFHALSVRIIREQADHLKYHNSSFIIIDDEDKKRIIKNIIKELNLEEEMTTKEALFNISKAKCFASSLNGIETLVDFTYNKVYRLYDKYLKENNAMDFDDLLLYAYDLLKVKSIQQVYVNKFKYILVDEYQDTSTIQNNILKLLFNKVNNLFMVGDMDQAIYSWRGAKSDNMLKIQKNFKKPSIIKLEQNYRSNSNILKVANNLIGHNTSRMEKNLWTNKESDNEVIFRDFSTNDKEVEFVVSDIEDALVNDVKYEDIAVLYRSNYQSRKMEEYLIKNKIPYIIYGGIRFYERMEIKDFIAYLRLIINNQDEISLYRVINTPKRKIGNKSLEKYLTYSRDNNMSIFDSLEHIGTDNAKEFASIIKEFKDIEKNFNDNFDKLVEKIKYEEYLLTQYDENNVIDRMQNIQEFKRAVIDSLEEGKTLRDFLNDLAIFSEKEDNTQEAIILSTIHGVKGLEFGNVYMIGMQMGKFPTSRSIAIDDLQEERRLCYVGVTRAINNLSLTASNYDFNGSLTPKSIFIDEMNVKNVENDWNEFFI